MNSLPSRAEGLRVDDVVLVEDKRKKGSESKETLGTHFALRVVDRKGRDEVEVGESIRNHEVVAEGYCPRREGMHP